MITRAYQNAKGERQEVAMSAAEWEVLTQDQLDEMLGLKAPAPAPAPAPVPAPAPAPAPARAPAAKPKAKGK